MSTRQFPLNIVAYGDLKQKKSGTFTAIQSIIQDTRELKGPSYEMVAPAENMHRFPELEEFFESTLKLSDTTIGGLIKIREFQPQANPPEGPLTYHYSLEYHSLHLPAGRTDPRPECRLRGIPLINIDRAYVRRMAAAHRTADAQTVISFLLLGISPRARRKADGNWSMTFQGLYDDRWWFVLEHAILCGLRTLEQWHILEEKQKKLIMNKLIAFTGIKYGFDEAGCLVVLDKTGPIPRDYQPGMCKPLVDIPIASLRMFQPSNSKPTSVPRQARSLFERSGLPPHDKERRTPALVAPTNGESQAEEQTSAEPQDDHTQEAQSNPAGKPQNAPTEERGLIRGNLDTAVVRFEGETDPDSTDEEVSTRSLFLCHQFLTLWEARR